MRIDNKKATFDYDITDRFEAGAVLMGPEVKSIRLGHAKLEGSFVRIIGGEAYLVNGQIFPYEYASVPQGGKTLDPKRTRKLLLHRHQLISLKSKLDSGNLTLVPLAWYTTGHRVKLEIGLGRGKKQYQKREKIRQHDLKLDLEREFRGKVK